MAETSRGAAEVRDLFADHLDFVTASTFEDAVQAFQARHPDLVIIGYHFDELRPYRFAEYVRSRRGATELPIVLVRILPSRMGRSTEEEVREAYRAIGVQDFFSIPDELHEHGRAAALARMRETVFDLLRIGIT